MSEEVLTKTLRPQTFASMVGQKELVTAILTQVKSKRIPNCWLFTGPTRGGKTTIARILALSLQLPPEKFGAPDAEDWSRWNSYDISEINSSAVSGVEEVGKIAKESQYFPNPGSRSRVIILDEAQRISSAAQNLLLKYMEDPPKSTYWIICTTEENKILPTVRARCYSLKVRPLDVDGIDRLLKRAAKKIGWTGDYGPLGEELVLKGISSPGQIVMAFEKFVAGISAKEATKIGEPVVDGLRICRAFIGGNWSVVAQELQRATPDDARSIRLAVTGYLRSVMLKGGGSIPPERAAATILALSGQGPLEEPAYLSWVAAILCVECKKYR